MKLTANMEDYLEAISFCADDKGVARVSDIRNMLGVKTPSVTGAMKLLAAEGYVWHEPYQGIMLTPKGKRVADDVKKRHALMSRFLTEVLGVNPKTADQDACKLEHVVSKETLAKLHAYLEKQTKS
jgi:DtxR family Mn-dependent transcriptional regulator